MGGINLIEQFLWVALIGPALSASFSKKVIASTISIGVFSLVTALLFLLAAAPDVAITEAAIGAAISTILIIFAIKRVGDSEVVQTNKLAWGTLIAAFFIVVVVLASDLPIVGDANSIANASVGKYYTDNTLMETGVPNAVTSVLASYRGYDTMVETYVILAAAFSAMLVLLSMKGAKND